MVLLAVGQTAIPAITYAERNCVVFSQDIHHNEVMAGIGECPIPTKTA